jgi:hypothetical protein
MDGVEARGGHYIGEVQALENVPLQQNIVCVRIFVNMDYFLAASHQRSYFIACIRHRVDFPNQGNIAFYLRVTFLINYITLTLQNAHPKTECSTRGQEKAAPRISAG